MPKENKGKQEVKTPFSANIPVYYGSEHEKHYKTLVKLSGETGFTLSALVRFASLQLAKASEEGRPINFDLIS